MEECPKYRMQVSVALRLATHSLLFAACVIVPCQHPRRCFAVAVVTAGGLGGMLYWLVIFPVDVVKSAMQTDAIVKADRKYPDMLTTTQARMQLAFSSQDMHAGPESSPYSWMCMDLQLGRIHVACQRQLPHLVSTACHSIANEYWSAIRTGWLLFGRP